MLSVASPLRQCSLEETPRLLEPFLAVLPWILFLSHENADPQKPDLSKPLGPCTSVPPVWNAPFPSLSFKLL